MYPQFKWFMFWSSATYFYRLTIIAVNVLEVLYNDDVILVIRVGADVTVVIR